MNWGTGITYLAETSLKGKQVRFGIKDRDRLEHISVMGRQGSGRAAFLAHMALQDIERGVGTVVLDANGQLVELLLERLPREIQNRVILFDPSDAEFPFSWNPIDDFRVAGEHDESLLTEALATLYRTDVSPLIEYAAREMLDRSDTSMLFLYDIVQDPNRRGALLPKGSPERKEFDEVFTASPQTVEAVGEHGRYLAKDSLIRNLLGQHAPKFTLDVLAQGGAVVVDLSRIRMFPTRITPLVRLFTHALRARTYAEGQEQPYALYFFDSARCLSRYDIEHLLPERRVACTIVDSPYGEGEEDKERRSTILQRSGSVITFASSQTDAPLLVKTFFPYLGLEDLNTLHTNECAVLLSIDAVRSRPFFARMLPLRGRQNISAQDIHIVSREKYALPRRHVDQLFMRRPAPSAQGSDPSSFSSAFRSIFTKGAAPGGSAAGAAPIPKPPALPAGVWQQPGTPADANKSQPPQELSEEELKDLLYVKPPSS